MSTLIELADKYKTDKGTDFFDKEPGKGHRYAQVYDLFLNHLRNKGDVKLLEIGIAKGASLCMWNEYFSSATIVGLDITLENVDKTRRLGVEGGGWPSPDNIILEQGSQTDYAKLREIIQKHGPFDIIIDDGSHRNEHQQQTFNFLFPLLNPGSMYIIEDIHCDKTDEKSTLNRIMDLMKRVDTFECEYMNLLYTDATSISCIIRKKMYP